MSVPEPQIKEDIGPAADHPRAATAIPDHEVLIVGAGISGMGAAIELKRRGIDDFVILERAHEVGGTWRDNTYPGIAVDITSFVYSYSFEQDPNWSRIYAPGAELQNYARRVACKYGLYPSIRFGVGVEGADFDEHHGLWRIQTNQGLITARHLVSAVGGLVTPKMPDIKGLQDFQGKLMHTARWDHDYNLRGKRVAVIGTGATGVQVIPAIADEVEQLSVFQRTPIWVLPKPDAELPAWLRTLFRWSGLAQRGVRLSTSALTETLMVIATIYYKRFPGLIRRFEKMGMDNLCRQLPKHPELREKLTPRYGFGCKRPTFSNEYFKTFARDDVDLVTAGIDCITPTGIRTRDGQEREFDVLVMATGFKMFDKDNLPTYPVRGRSGEDIRQHWLNNRYKAYEGLTVPDYPNFYIFLGPYALTATSYFVMVEGNAVHMARCIEEARRRNAKVVEVRQKAHDRYFDFIQKRQRNTVFLNHNCASANSFYFDQHGDAPLARPSTSAEMLLRARTLPMRHYRFE